MAQRVMQLRWRGCCRCCGQAVRRIDLTLEVPWAPPISTARVRAPLLPYARLRLGLGQAVPQARREGAQTSQQASLWRRSPRRAHTALIQAYRSSRHGHTTTTAGLQAPT